MSNGRVLIAEDEHMVRAVLCNMLNNLGYIDIDMVCCGRAAHCLSSIKYEFVMLDIHMPSCYGDDAAHLIRTLGCNNKILLITGDNSFDSNDFPILYKPFGLEELRASIEILNSEKRVFERK